MQGNSKVHFIPPIPKREQRVGIYCRVSTNSMDQLQSLTAQVSHLTRLTAAMSQWVLADVYMDIATSKTGSSRKEFNRLLEDCNSRKIEIVITKNISRFGRDTVEILDTLNQLRTLGVRVIFEQEELDTANTDSDLMISVIESLAQAENESRSDNIRWGIKQRATSGTSKLYDRKCYGYKHDKEGHLIIDEETAISYLTDLYGKIRRIGKIHDARIILGGLGRRNPQNADQLALLLMETTRRTKEVIPQLTLRCYEGMNQTVFDKALQVNAEGCSFPILYSDDTNIPAIQKAFQVNLDDAMSYIPAGCGE